MSVVFSLVEFESVVQSLVEVILYMLMLLLWVFFDIFGVLVLLKMENFQCIGLFKICGVVYWLLWLSVEECLCGVVVVFVGNYVQGVVFVVQVFGIFVMIFMFLGVFVLKLFVMWGYGVEVVLEGEMVVILLCFVVEFLECIGVVFIYLFDYCDIVIGQGMFGFELFDDVLEVDMVVFGIGGGGFIVGVVVVVKVCVVEFGCMVCIIGVQVENVVVMLLFFVVGELVDIVMWLMIVDGILVVCFGVFLFVIIKDFVDEVVMVLDDDFVCVIFVFLEQVKVVVELVGVVGVVVILVGKVFGIGMMMVVFFGGNIDLFLLQCVVLYGLVVFGCYLMVCILLFDCLGQLVCVLELIVEVGVNVIEVMYIWYGYGLQISEVIFEFSVEICGLEYLEFIFDIFCCVGFELMFVLD